MFRFHKTKSDLEIMKMEIPEQRDTETSKTKELPTTSDTTRSPYQRSPTPPPNQSSTAPTTKDGKIEYKTP